MRYGDRDTKENAIEIVSLRKLSRFSVLTQGVVMPFAGAYF